MNSAEFQNFSTFLQNTSAIVNNSELRTKAYREFDDVYEYLENQIWSEGDLIERHTFSNEAVFQNIAEGYFKLGFIETVFFEYSRLVYELWYIKTIEYQNKANKRMHKGTQVHQIAVIFQIQNKNSKAWDYYLAGFTEDVIDGRDYIKSQAYKVLIAQNLSRNNLALFVKTINAQSRKDKYNPLQIVEAGKKEAILPSFEENENIDYLKLNKAKELWEELLKEDSNGK